MSFIIDVDLKDRTTDNVYNALVESARRLKNNHLQYEENGIKLIVSSIPDIVDRVEWWYEGLHISASYAKVLIERSLNESL